MSLSEIRVCFPALARRHNGNAVAYFDGPGGTQVPRTVAEAMSDYLFHHNANLGWCYPTSAESDEALALARRTLAVFVNGEEDGIVFGNNMTTLTFHVARALGREWRAGDEIVVTELDHHANVDPWRDAAAAHGLSVRTARMDPKTGLLDGDHLESLIGNRTRLVAVGAASNALGTVNDVARVCRMARSKGALSFIDAVHYAPHFLPDMQAFGCDFLACSSYKFYGPHAGVLCGRPDLLSRLPAPRLLPAPNSGPQRLETGTCNLEGIVGARTAVEFLADLTGAGTLRERLRQSYRLLHARAEAHTAALWEGLSATPGVTLFGPSPGSERTPTISFTVRGVSAKEVSRRLAAEGLFLSHGDFYAMTVVRRLGVEGLVRAGMACYTTREEVRRLIRGVRRIAAEM